ncbi:hypothetical protein YOLOSWAG_246 [Erwinia phage vB_EamM_Yoloswag]|uniref:Uncharacterized protein n=1 Tax=Erwinia phage vB_EamM_Yoloswag TaxID=1958956 RepID=A0A1S6L3F3_9CAUD|nr:hypothetical protein HOR66_gp246 [Erwinia phage vB_EamM_Yoloswag]AQT28721.1 hypothetical protein YOLOSWAG_246 [Erwinia phage vB_EamM_Yoloswag]
MTYKLELQVDEQNEQALTQEIAEYADKHDISYVVEPSESGKSTVTFESAERQPLVDLIEQAYAPDDDAEHQQYIDKIHEV